MLEYIQAQLKEDSYYFESEDFEHVEEGTWEQDYKYQVRADVFKHKETGRYFQLVQSRSGSYHTDWYYNDPGVYEVKPETKTVTVTTFVLVK